MTYSKILCGIFCIVSCLSADQNVSTSFIRETPEDIQEALVNFPERVPKGPEVKTIYGSQLTPGDLRSDLKINQQIFNDIAQFQITMAQLMQMVLTLGTNPTLLDAVQVNMNLLQTMLTNAGIRYNLVANFDILKRELAQIRAEIVGAPRTTDFMLFRPRLETILAVIENKLRTLLVRSCIRKAFFVRSS